MSARQNDDLRSHAWKKARAKVLAHAHLCYLCGLPIDRTVDPRSRWAPSVDHVIPRSLGGSLTAPANLRAAHYGCNSKRGNGTKRRRPPTSSTGSASRTW